MLPDDGWLIEVAAVHVLKNDEEELATLIVSLELEVALDVSDLKGIDDRKVILRVLL